MAMYLPRELRRVSREKLRKLQDIRMRTIVPGSADCGGDHMVANTSPARVPAVLFAVEGPGVQGAVSSPREKMGNGEGVGPGGIFLISPSSDTYFC